MSADEIVGWRNDQRLSPVFVSHKYLCRHKINTIAKLRNTNNPGFVLI